MPQTLDAIEMVLESIAAAKQELIRIDPANDSIRKRVDDAYTALSAAAAALLNMVTKDE